MDKFEKAINRMILVLLVVFALYFFWMLIQGITPAQPKIAERIDKRFSIEACPRLIDLQTGEVSFYKGGRWVVVK